MSSSQGKRDTFECKMSVISKRLFSLMQNYAKAGTQQLSMSGITIIFRIFEKFTIFKMWLWNPPQTYMPPHTPWWNERWIYICLAISNFSKFSIFCINSFYRRYFNYFVVSAVEIWSYSVLILWNPPMNNWSENAAICSFSALISFKYQNYGFERIWSQQW